MGILNESKKTKRNGEKVICVGMTPSGIAVGARAVMYAFAKKLRRGELRNVSLTSMDYEGMHKLEPIVIVYDKDGAKTIYVKMTEEKAETVMKEHIIGGKICKEFTLRS